MHHGGRHLAHRRKPHSVEQGPLGVAPLGVVDAQEDDAVHPPAVVEHRRSRHRDQPRPALTVADLVGEVDGAHARSIGWFGQPAFEHAGVERAIDHLLHRPAHHRGLAEARHRGEAGVGHDHLEVAVDQNDQRAARLDDRTQPRNLHVEPPGEPHALVDVA